MIKLKFLKIKSKILAVQPTFLVTQIGKHEFLKKQHNYIYNFNESYIYTTL